MSRVLEGQKRNFLFIVMLGVILILAILLVWNLMGNKGETKNSAEGASSSSSAPSGWRTANKHTTYRPRQS